MRSCAYFAPLVTKPDIILQPGYYLTRGGEVVQIEQVSTRHDFGCVGAYAERIRERWHKSGRIFATSECRHDVVSLNPT